MSILEKITKAARRVDPACEIIVTDYVVEVALPEDCPRRWWATGGTLLIADLDRFGGLAGALRATLADIRMGTHPVNP